MAKVRDHVIYILCMLLKEMVAVSLRRNEKLHRWKNTGVEISFKEDMGTWLKHRVLRNSVKWDGIAPRLLDGVVPLGSQ